MDYLETLRYLQRNPNRLECPQVSIHTVDRLPGVDEACADDALFGTPHKIGDLAFTATHEPASPASC